MNYTKITTIEELIKYFDKCRETGICSFDFETTINQEEKKVQLHLIEDLDLVIGDIKFKIAFEEDKKIKKELKKELKIKEKLLADQIKEYKSAPLDPHRGEICTVSLSAAPNESVVVFLSHTEGTNFCDYINPETRRNIFLRLFNDMILSDNKVTKIVYNLPFESKFLLKYGCFISSNVVDPLVLIVRTLQAKYPHEIKYPKLPTYGKGLKAMSKQYLNRKMTEFLDVTQGKMFDELSADSEEALTYSAEDSDLSLQLYNYFRPIAESIKIQQTYKRPYKNYYEWLQGIEMPFGRVIGQMEYHGFMWNSSKEKELVKKANEDIEDYRIKIIDLAKKYKLDIDPQNSGKTKDVKSFLFDVLGCPYATLSDKTGNPSVDKIAINDMLFLVENDLESLEDEYNEDKVLVDRPYKQDIITLLNYMLEIQKSTTILSTHINGRKKHINKVTGRIHANYGPWTSTSRLNSSKPNGQNVPRPDNDNFGVRNIYQSAPGKVLMLIDYSGFELRLIAWASGDEEMIKVFKSNGDMHRKTAATLTGKKEEDVTKSERSIAKAGNFGINYGGTEFALRKTFKDLNIRKSLDYCKQVVDAVKNTYPKIVEYQQKCIEFASNYGYCETIYGYRRILPNINNIRAYKEKGRDERRASNSPIQGSAADIMKKSQNMIYDMIAKNNLHGHVDMISQIHDEVILEIDNDIDLIEKVKNWCVKTMEQKPIPDFPVDIKVDVEITSGGWGDKIPYDEWREKCKNYQNTSHQEN